MANNECAGECEICGYETEEDKCKINCPNCGFRQDCSDPK